MKKIIDEYRPGRRIPKMGNLTYTAHMTAHCLRKMCKNKKFNIETFPKGVLTHLKEFFASMKKIVTTKDPNICGFESAGEENYEICRYIISRINENTTEHEIIREIGNFLALVNALEKGFVPNKKQLETMKRLCVFFKKIYQEGSGEHYNEMMVEAHRHMR